jgi:hypothetical protein
MKLQITSLNVLNPNSVDRTPPTTARSAPCVTRRAGRCAHVGGPGYKVILVFPARGDAHRPSALGTTAKVGV